MIYYLEEEDTCLLKLWHGWACEQEFQVEKIISHFFNIILEMRKIKEILRL